MRLLDHLKVHALIFHLPLLALHFQAPKISSYVFKMFLFFSLVVSCLTLMPFFPFGRFLKIMVTSDVCSPVTPVYPRIFPRISDSTWFLGIPTLPKVYSVVENVFVQCRTIWTAFLHYCSAVAAHACPSLYHSLIIVLVFFSHLSVHDYQHNYPVCSCCLLRPAVSCM